MKPFVKLDESTLSDGTVFSLHKHDDKFYLKYDGCDLMSTKLTYSEEMLAQFGCERLLPGKSSRPKHPRILIGGLGLGFTLKRTLELVGKPATVEVAELMPPLIEWNRTFLVEHNGPLLQDPRTKIIQGDLYDIINRQPKSRFDALLLDIDNTPDDLITPSNARLYTSEFLATIASILTPSGCVTYWLSEPAPKFKKTLIKAGFRVEEHAVAAHKNAKRANHCIYLCRGGR